MENVAKTRRNIDELQENDMFNLGGVSYIVTRIDDNDSDQRVVTAAKMIGRKTWKITFAVPRDVPFLAQS